MRPRLPVLLFLFFTGALLGSGLAAQDEFPLRDCHVWLPMTGVTEEDMDDAIEAGYDTLLLKLQPPLTPDGGDVDARFHADVIGQAREKGFKLILAVLGSILAGLATPTEAAGVGGMGALLLASLRREISMARLKDIMQATLKISSMVFLILIGASIFSLVFRGYGGDDGVRAILGALPGGVVGAVIVVMLVMFLLGFVLDFIEITFVVVPIVGPVLLAMGLDPVWLGIMIAINLQTSFLTPPFGFALFYLRGVAPASVTTGQIYRGVIPFVAIQIFALLLIAAFPELVTWLPGKIYGN